MSLPTFIHVITWILIATVTIYGLSTNQIQQLLIAQYINRGLFVVMIVTGLIMMVHTVAMSPFFVILKFIAGITTIGLIELMMYRKRGANVLRSKQIMLLTISFAVTALLGTIIARMIG